MTKFKKGDIIYSKTLKQTRIINYVIKDDYSCSDLSAPRKPNYFTLSGWYVEQNYEFVTNIFTKEIMKSLKKNKP